MRISVIIPCYNAQAYLAACLDSLLCQSVRDIEVILIDDGSMDNTAQIAQAYASKDTRIRLIRQKNAGVSAARNAGLEKARGDWICFVDADDLLPPKALETLLSHTGDDVDMVVSLHETFDESGTRRVDPDTRWMDLKGEKRRHAAALRLIEGDTVLNIMCNKLHRRAKLLSEGLKLDPGVRIAEDALFNLEAVLCADQIAFCDHVTYRYRIHGASATQSQRQSEFDRHLPWFLSMQKMLARRGMFETHYAAYFQSVVLRLYKDGSVSGVMREFNQKAKPLLMGELDESRLSLREKAMRALCRTNVYPYIYPAIYPFEVLARKLRQAKNALIMRRKDRG